MGLSLRNLGKKLWETATPQNEGALRQAQANLQRANQAMAAPARYGVLRNPQIQRAAIANNQAPRFNLPQAARSAAADTFTKPQAWISAPKANIGSFRGSGLAEDFINSPFKVGQGMARVGSGDIGGGLGQIATGLIEGPAGFIPVGKVAQATGKGMKLLPKVLKGAKVGAKEGAVFGGAYGAGSAAEQGGSLLDVAKGGAIGTVTGGVAGGLGGAAFPVAGAGVRQATKQFQDVPLTKAQAKLRDKAVVGYNEATARGKHDVADRFATQIDVIDASSKAPVKKAIDKFIPEVSADFDPNYKPKVTLKERGFKQNIEKTLPDSPNAQTVAEAIPGYKPITNKGTLNKAANAISENPQAEFANLILKKQLNTADDVAKGNLLLREAIEKGDTETAIQLGTKMGIDGTKLGQAIQAYSTFKKTTPEGIVTYASKKAGRAGKELSPEVANDLIVRAKAIADMPESLEKAQATRDLLGQADSVGRGWKEKVSEVLAIPRSAMATLDFSAPLRQGAVLGTRYPKQFGKAFAESVKYFAKPKYYEQAMYELTQRPTYGLMKKNKLAVDAAEDLTGTEEQFMTSLLESKVAKKLGFGQAVAASSRAYSGFLTKFRADVFDSVVKDFNKSGVELDEKATKSLAKFINSASGRGTGTTLDKHGGLLSQALFSPRLWKSRIDTLNPAYYGRLDPAARKLALQSAGTFAATATTILSLAALAGADVESDPRSADFGKIKVGDTRYDILGGHQQNIRLAAQLISGQKLNSVTGELQTLGPERGFGKPSRADLAYQFLMNKSNPIIGFGEKVLRGTDPVGNPVNPAKEAAKLLIPLNIQSTYETAKSQGSLAKGVAMNMPGTFGAGVQTYGQDKAPPKNPASAKKGEPSKDGYSLTQNDDGKYEVKIGDKTIKKDNLKEARDEIAKDSLKKSDENLKIVGETVYRKNKDGKVTPTRKIDYDYSLGQNKLQSAKKKEDLDGWFKQADVQLANLETQLADPTLDELDKSNIREKIDNLIAEAEKYNEYGGFKKGRSGYASGGGSRGGGRGRSGGGGGGGGTDNSLPNTGSIYKYALDPDVGGAIAKPKVTAKSAGKTVTRKSVASGKPKVTIKRSRV